MADNSGQAADMLRSLLGSDAGEKLQSLFGSGNNSDNSDNSDNSVETESTKAIQVSDNYTDHIRGLISELSRPNDPRSQLLLSLKPYMSDNRKRSIDNAVKLLNISKISGIFK